MKSFRLKTFLFLVLISRLALAQTDFNPTKIYDANALKKDFRHWRGKLENNHPLLYLYTPKYKLDRYFDSLYNEIKAPMTELNFIKLLSPITAIIQDGHNYIIPSKNTLNQIRNNAELLPLELRYIDDKLFVVQNYDTANPKLIQTEILSINSHTSSEIFSKLLNNLGKDVSNQQHQIALINGSFRFYYHLFFGFSDEFIIHYKTRTNLESKCIVKAEKLKDIQNIQKIKINKRTPNFKSGLNFRIIDSVNTAVLNIKTFAPNTSNRKFKKEIAYYFNLLKNSNSSNLIIDLRGNAGGNPYLVNFILKYLFVKPFEQARECRIVNNFKSEVFTKRTRIKWYPRYGIGTFKSHRHSFKGNIFVLVNEETFSAGVIFASVLKKYNRAKFIGTETGGNPIVMSGYLIKTSWELPNTKIQYSIGRLCTIYDKMELNKGKGLQPDYLLKHEPEDFTSNVDRWLEYTLQLIKNGD